MSGKIFILKYLSTIYRGVKINWEQALAHGKWQTFVTLCQGTKKNLIVKKFCCSPGASCYSIPFM
jgi:hypothetical protein